MITPDTLIQVQDARDTWHVAHIGRGVLCAVAKAKIDEHGRCEPLVDTIRWDYGLDQVSCQDCTVALAQLVVAAA